MTYTLPELLDLALCSPEVGAVNFNILRTVLLTIIEETHLSDIAVDIFEDTDCGALLSPHSIKGASETLRSSFKRHKSTTTNVIVTGSEAYGSSLTPTGDLIDSDEQCQDLLDEKSIQDRTCDKIQQKCVDSLECIPVPDEKLLIGLKQKSLAVPCLLSDENNIQSNHSTCDVKSPKKVINSKDSEKLNNSYEMNIIETTGFTDNGVIRTIETSVWELQQKIVDLEKAVEQLLFLSNNETSSAAKVTGDENLSVVSNLWKTTGLSSQVDGTEAGLKRVLITEKLHVDDQTDEEWRENLAEFNFRLLEIERELDILKIQVSNLIVSGNQFTLDSEGGAELSASKRVAEQQDNQVNMCEEHSVEVHSRLDRLEQEMLVLAKHGSSLMRSGSHLLVENGNEDNRSLITIQHSLHLLQGCVEKLEQKVVHLQTDDSVHDKYLQEIWSCVQDLQETKAEKEDYITTLQNKADKITLERKVSRGMFENSCTELKSELSKMLNRLTSLELKCQKSITELTGDLEKQMKKMDLDSVKSYVEKEIRGISRKLIELEVSRNLSNDAATTKKQLLKCISCTKPRSLCENSGWSCGLQFSQLTPPYSVFGTTKLQKPLNYLNTMKMTIIEKELTQLQKDNSSVVSFSQPTEILGFETSSQGVNHISSHAVLNEHSHFAVSVPQKSGRTVSCNNCFHNGRNCGGKHTLTTPFSRTKKSVFPSLFTTSPYIQQTVLRGDDGHLYRGSIQKSTFLKRSPNWDHLFNIESGRPTSTSSQNLVSRAQM